MTKLRGDLRDQIKNAITTAMRQRYVSTSSCMGYLTGNAYQSVDLGDQIFGGYRLSRTKIFDRFNFTGRSVIDCGSNLGELSRLARKRGAFLVDGIEYDHYFVELARLINAYQGTTRVSFVQGDLTNADTITDIYDVSLAFSVFPYIRPILDKIGAHTRDALVIETHNLSDLRRTYIDPLSQYFPHHTLLDYTDFGGQDSKRRAVFVFAKKQHVLHSDSLMTSTVNVSHSNLRYVDAMRGIVERIGNKRRLDDIEKVLALAAGMENDLPALTAGRTYWLEMMKGYLQAKKEGLRSDNEYAKMLRELLTKYNFDPALSDKLSSQDDLLRRVSDRFSDIDKLAGPDPQVFPVTIFTCDEKESNFSVIQGDTGTIIHARQMDGYHRMFWAFFFGVVKIDALYTV